MISFLFVICKNVKVPLVKRAEGDRNFVEYIKEGVQAFAYSAHNLKRTGEKTGGLGHATSGGCNPLRQAFGSQNPPFTTAFKISREQKRKEGDGECRKQGEQVPAESVHETKLDFDD